MKTLHGLALLAIAWIIGCEDPVDTPTDSIYHKKAEVTPHHDVIRYDTIYVHDTVYLPESMAPPMGGTIRLGDPTDTSFHTVPSPGTYDDYSFEIFSHGTHGHVLSGPGWPDGSHMYTTPSWEEHTYSVLMPSTPRIWITVRETWENYKLVVGHTRDEPLKLTVDLLYSVVP